MNTVEDRLAKAIQVNEELLMAVLDVLQELPWDVLQELHWKDTITAGIFHQLQRASDYAEKHKDFIEDYMPEVPKVLKHALHQYYDDDNNAVKAFHFADTIEIVANLERRNYKL